MTREQAQVLRDAFSILANVVNAEPDYSQQEIRAMCDKIDLIGRIEDALSAAGVDPYRSN